MSYESSFYAHSGYYTASGDLMVGLNNNSNNITISNWQNTASNRRMQNFVFNENGTLVDYLWNASQSCEVNLYDQEFSLTNVHKAICVDSASATMRGTSGAEYLQGGSGDDQIWGGQTGIDTLVGGAGSDQYWWGVDNSGNVLIKDDTSNTQDTLYLYNLNASQVSTAIYGNDLVISSGVNTVTIENGANNKIGVVKFADGSAITGDQMISSAPRYSGPAHHLNIKFDYSMDVNGWFTDSRKAVLEQAANAWEEHITTDLAPIQAGTTEYVYDLTSYMSYNYNGSVVSIPTDKKYTTLTSTVDDIVIYVGTSNSSNNNDSGSAWITNSQVAGINFNLSSSQNATDGGLLKIAEHEIGHVLGLGGQDSAAYASLESYSNGSYYFNGENAKALNGGLPIQMWDINHPNNYDVSAVMGYGPNVSSVTNMDLAMLKDIGWSVV